LGQQVATSAEQPSAERHLLLSSLLGLRCQASVLLGNGVVVSL
jgi:hypothetical protein